MHRDSSGVEKACQIIAVVYYGCSESQVPLPIVLFNHHQNRYLQNRPCLPQTTCHRQGDKAEVVNLAKVMQFDRASSSLSDCTSCKGCGLHLNFKANLPSGGIITCFPISSGAQFFSKMGFHSPDLEPSTASLIMYKMCPKLLKMCPTQQMLCLLLNVCF